MKNADGKYAIRQNGNSNLYMTVNGTVADGAYLIGQTAENYQWELEEATELPRTYKATWKVGNKTLLSESQLSAPEGAKVTIPSYWERSMASSTVTVNGVESSLDALKNMTITEPTVIEVVGTLKVPEAGKYYRFINANFTTRYMKEDVNGIVRYSENLSDNDRSCAWLLESTSNNNGTCYLKNANSGQYLLKPNGNNDIQLIELDKYGCPYWFKKESGTGNNRGVGFIYITSSENGENGKLLNMNTNGHYKVLAYNRDDWASYWIAEELTQEDVESLNEVSFTKHVNLTLQITMDGDKRYEASSSFTAGVASNSLTGKFKWLRDVGSGKLTMNGVAIDDPKTVIDENGNITPTESATYVFALKTKDYLAADKLYQISSAVTKILEGTPDAGRGGKKMYGKSEMVYTKAVGNNIESEPFTLMAHSLWKFEYEDGSDTNFKIYNVVTGKYIGKTVTDKLVNFVSDKAGAGVYKLVPTSTGHHVDNKDDATNYKEMRDNTYAGALFKIKLAEAAYEAGVDKSLHINSGGNNQLMFYDHDEIWSKWYFTSVEATETKVEYVKDIESRLLVQGRVTPSKKADMTGMVITKEDGTNVTAVLTDDNAATSASANVNSYLQVDLGSTSVSAFAFYTKRTPNSNNRPTEIEVQASANGTDFTRLYTFYGIPVANEDFYSPSYPLVGQQYLRFVVKATYSASSTFDFSEFHIQTTKGVLPDALAAKSLEAGKKAIDAVCSPYNTTDGYYQGASEALRDARDNALDYAAAHKALKDRIADLTPFVDRTDMEEGDEVHQFTIARTATGAEDWKAALTGINGYVDDVNNTNINTKVGCETVLATLPTITFNTPKPGQVYRLKSMQLNATNGTYAAAGQTVLSPSPVTNSSVEKDVLLQYIDGKLVSPITGAELTVYGLNHFKFSEHRSVKGTYRVETYYPEGTSGSNARILYASTLDENENGMIDYSQIGGNHETVTNTSWYLEPVKSYSVKMNPVGNHRWATFYSDNKVFLPEGVKARYVKGNDDGNWAETTDGSKVYKLVYTTVGEGGVLPAVTGVWLDKRTADGNDATGQETVVLCESEYNDAAAVESNWFVGSEAGDDAYTTSGKLYALGKPGDNPAGFYTFTATQETETNRIYKLTANKAYLEVPSSVVASLNAFGFVLVEDEGEVTGVQDVPVAGEAVEDDGVYYDLTGKRVVNPTQRGIYIKNGKKMVIK